MVEKLFFSLKTYFFDFFRKKLYVLIIYEKHSFSTFIIDNFIE